jgi:hypothetical protein
VTKESLQQVNNVPVHWEETAVSVTCSPTCPNISYILLLNLRLTIFSLCKTKHDWRTLVPSINVENLVIRHVTLFGYIITIIFF